MIWTALQWKRLNPINDSRTRQLDNGPNKRTEYSILQGKELHSKKYRITTRNHEDLPWPRNSRSTWWNWNLQCSATTLLVARPTHIREELRPRLWDMSTIWNRQITIETCLFTHWRSEITQTLRKLFHGFNHWPPSRRWTRFYLGRGRPRPFEGGNFNNLQQNTHFWRDSMITSGKPLKMVWTTGQDHFQQRPSICIESIHRTVETIRN